MFLEQHNLKAIKLWYKKKRERKRGIRKRKTAKPRRKDFELLFPFEGSGESEHLLVGYVLWVCICQKVD